MKKIYSFLLTAVMLLVSANTWAVKVTTAAELKTALEGASGTVTLGNKISFGTITGTTLSQSYIQITQYAKEYYYYNITGNITLDLAGYNLYGTVKYKSYLFYINPGASLTIINSSSTAATITPLNSYTATSDARFFLINDATAQLHLNSSNIYYKGANKSAYFYDSNTAKDVTAGYFSSTADAPQLAYDADNCALENTNTEVTISYTAAGDRFDVPRYWWKVEKMSSNFIVNGVECATVAAAVTASQNGTYPILLLKDVTVASTEKLNADVTFDGATYKLTSSPEITKGVYNCQVSAKNNVKGGTFNNAFSISGSSKYITGGVFANQPTTKIKSGYQAVSGNTNGKWAVAQTANISDDKIAQGSYYDDVTDFVAATSTAIINTTINTTYAYKTYVFLNTNMEGGKVAGGVYTVNIPTSMIAAGYNLVTAKISTTNYYVIGKGAKVDGSGKIIAGTFKADPTPYVNTTDYQVTNNGGVYTVSMLPGHGEAFIGSQEYETLAEAIAAVPTNNVETKITINRAVTSACSTIAKQNIVIDFNGKACTGTLTTKGTLKLMDSSAAQTGGTTGAVTSSKYGVLIIESGKYGQIKGGDKDASITINGGTFTVSSGNMFVMSTAYTAVTDAGVATPYNKYWTITSTLTINGGTFTNTGTGNIINNTGRWKLFINGGTFTTNNNNIISCSQPSYPLHTEDEWYIHIAGGEYHSGTADPLYLYSHPGMGYPDAAHQSMRAWVTGGTFDKEQAVNDENGHFPMNTDLYEQHDNGNGTWTVQVIPGYERVSSGSGNFGTICLPRLVTKGNYTGATFYRILGQQYNDDFIDELVLEEVDNLEAGVPYIYQAEADAISCTYADDVLAEASQANGLIGTLVAMPLAQGPDVYAITQFGLLNIDIDGLTLPANCAYIDWSKVSDYDPDAEAPAPGRRRISMSTNGTHVTTSVEQSVDTKCEAAKKVLKNGRVYILRGEHTYDMTGNMIR